MVKKKNKKVGLGGEEGGGDRRVELLRSEKEVMILSSQITTALTAHYYWNK